MRFSPATVLGIVAIVGAGAFAAGRSSSPAPAVVAEPSTPSTPPVATLPVGANDESLPPGHPPTGGAGMGAATGESLPPGHPHVDSTATPGTAAAPFEPPPAGPSALEWKAPARWQSVPNASTMRLATFRIPRAPGDTEDAELSITQAGGSVDANATRWIGQFDAAGQKTAKRSTRKVGALDVAVVEAQGVYSGGMGMGTDTKASSDRALLGAIVSTPGMPHFFKLTGPVKTVLAARAEFDAMIGSLVAKK